MMAVCLIVTLPGIPLNFDTPLQSFRVQHSLTVILIVVLADSLPDIKVSDIKFDIAIK